MPKYNYTQNPTLISNRLIGESNITFTIHFQYTALTITVVPRLAIALFNDVSLSDGFFEEFSTSFSYVLYGRFSLSDFGTMLRIVIAFWDPCFA